MSKCTYLGREYTVIKQDGGAATLASGQTDRIVVKAADIKMLEEPAEQTEEKVFLDEPAEPTTVATKPYKRSKRSNQPAEEAAKLEEE